MKSVLIILLTLITAIIIPSAFGVNRVLNLDGDGDYVEIADSESLNAINSQVTMEAWIKATAFANQWMPIIYKGDERIDNLCSNRSYTLWLRNNGRLLLASVPSDQNQMQLLSPIGLLALDTWYHVSGIIDAKSGVMKILLNGAEVASQDFGKDIHVSTLPLRIGWTNEEGWQGLFPFAGQIDDVRIWNIARTKEEIRATMHTSLSGKEPGLVGYWRFDDGNIAVDSSPSHADGKLIGDAHCVEAELPKPGELVMLSGKITDEEGKPIPNASVRLEQDGSEIRRTQTDDSGNYWIALFHPVRGLYDLSTTRGNLGDWQENIRLRDGESQTLNLTLKEAISIEGRLLMLDDVTPHVAVPVQAISNGKVVAETLSDEKGKYRLINLKNGRYQLRCQILGGYVYHSPEGEVRGKTVQIQRGQTLENIDFRFAPFKKGTWKSYTTLDGLPHHWVDAIHRAPDGMLWFGTGGGVSRYDGKEFVNLTTKIGLTKTNWVYAIQDGPDGAMWFGTNGGGVFRYDGKKYLNFTTKEGLAGNVVYDIHCDSDGILWFRTSVGVSRYDGKEFVNSTTQKRWIDKHTTPDGVMWSGTWRGVSRYDGQGYVNFTTQDGLIDNRVNAIHCDSDGMVWIGTHRNGVSRYDEKNCVNFTTKDGLANNPVFAIHRDPDGVMWCGTEGSGVFRYDGKDFVNFTTKDGLASNYVSAIYRDPDGIMWFGTWGGGVSRYDGKDFVNFTTKDGLLSNSVATIYGDSDGRVIWFGTDGGVSRYDGKEFKNFTTKDGLANGWIWRIHRDFDGVMWFGINIGHTNIDRGGVSRYDGKGFKNFTTKDGLVNNNILSIYQDSDGVMWFGTAGGVSRYDGKEFVTLTGNLENNVIEAIYETPDGVMWLGTEGGVYQYDGTTWASLDMRDGLVGNSIMSIHQDSDGFLWFGTLNGGITRYRRSGNSFLKAHLVSIKTEIEYTDLQALPSITTGHRVTIRYDSIDFKTVPEKRQYRCRIREIDADWRPPTKDTFFDHTFKKPGDYTFEVQAIDRDLNYSEPASLTLKVVPPFYLRASFLVPTISGGTILITALTISLIILTRHRRRIRAYERSAVQELQDANRVQMLLMPDTAPPIEGLEIAGKCLPANTVSGDFFDYLEGRQPNEVALIVADVTGKAMKGAMNAIMTDGILRATANEQEQFSPASLMIALNNVLKVRTERFMNVTMVIGLINAEAQILTIANAGHHAYPILLRNSEIQALKVGGLPLGMKAGIEYDEEQFRLESGDVLILMTDGIIEAQDSEERYYSDSGRLEKTISLFTQEMSAEAMIDAIISDAIAFGESKTTRDDDMTVVIAKVL